MALVKTNLKNTLYDGIYKVLISQSNKATEGDEDESPEKIIENISDKLADVITDAVDAYIRSGDITVGPSNISVVSTTPGTSAVVSSILPAKIK